MIEYLVRLDEEEGVGLVGDDADLHLAGDGLEAEARPLFAPFLIFELNL